MKILELFTIEYANIIIPLLTLMATLVGYFYRETKNRQYAIGGVILALLICSVSIVKTVDELGKKHELDEIGQHIEKINNAIDSMNVNEEVDAAELVDLFQKINISAAEIFPLFERDSIKITELHNKIIYEPASEAEIVREVSSMRRQLLRGQQSGFVEFGEEVGMRFNYIRDSLLTMNKALVDTLKAQQRLLRGMMIKNADSAERLAAELKSLNQRHTEDLVRIVRRITMHREDY